MTTANHRRFRALMLSSALCGLLGGGLTAALPASAEEPEVTDLSEITVTGSSYETEGTESYTSRLVSVGEKAALPQREVPQSTSVVTRRQIEDAGYSALETAVEGVPGLLVLNNDEGRSSLFSRGFEFDYLYYDGLPAPVSSIYGTQPDLSIVDHVEVLKGPAGLFTAIGSPAGAMNMRLKQATRTDPGGSVTGTVDSNGHYRGELDFGGALNAQGTLRGRLAAAYGDGDGFVDKQENGVTSLYGTLAWDISPDTLATLSVSRMKRDISPFNGLPTRADGTLLWLDSDATTAADWNRFDNETTDAVAAIEHRFANGARAKFSLRQARQTADFLYAYSNSAADAENRIDSLAWLARKWEQNVTALDAQAELPFRIGSWAGSAILGADYQKAKATTRTGRGTISGSWDLDDWDVSDVAEPDVSYSSATRERTETKGLYSQIRVRPLSSLALIGGARVSWYDGSSTDLTSGETARQVRNGHVTPFAGLTWDVTPDVTLYASYSEIFQPQLSYSDADGDPLKPLTARQSEIGAKAEFGGLNLSAAYFDLRQQNVAQLVSTGVYAALDAARSHGVELTAAGEIGRNLHLSAGYTYTDTEYTKGESKGDVFSTYTPRNMLKLSLTRDVTEGPAAGWSFGVRLRAVTGFSSTSRGTTIRAPGYGIVDLMVRKRLSEDTDLRLGIVNALDKDYYSRVGSTSLFNFRGEPRTLTLSMTRRF